MRVSYKWLTQAVDLHGISPEEVADKLTNAGVAVDTVEPRCARISGVVAGRIVECVPHPNADKLHVCQVDVGAGSNLTIVCGAPNVAAGQKVPAALVGATLPGGPIGKAELRGIESQGMLCSASEIGLEVKWLPKEQTTGLYILPADTPVGSDIVSLLELDDTILDLDLTPNRADCMSIRGLAYEVAAIFERSPNFPEPGSRLEDSTDSGNAVVKIRIETSRCSRYEAQGMEFTNHGQSPLWMQMRLLSMGIRPISMIVDVTNYVMLEWGQPLHAFDLDRVRQQTIVVRQGRADESIVTLDGVKRELTEDTVVIADLERTIGIAGVMGGENSEITETTRKIVIESAAFDAPSVRRTGQRLGLRSEAQQRFEKGVDVQAVRGALLRAVNLLESLGGATRIGNIVTAQNAVADASENAEEPGRPAAVVFRPNRCNELLGTKIPTDEMQRIFVRLGFQVNPIQGETKPLWRVTVPTRRPDIAIEADLIEEIGRLYGLDEIPSSLMQGTSVGLRTPWQQFLRHARQVLVGAGFNEVVPYTFSHPDVSDALRFGEETSYRRMIPLMRPMSEERTVLRTHLLPGLAAVGKYNLDHGVAGGRIFEIGRVYLPESLPLRLQPKEPTMLGLFWFGEEEVHFGVPHNAYDFLDIKGVLELWLESLGLLKEARFEPANEPWLHPGRSAKIVVKGTCVGSFGEVHPLTASAFHLNDVLYAEVNLEQAYQAYQDDWKVEELPRYPASKRDLAVVVEDSVEVKQLLDSAGEAVETVLANSLESARVFDVYTGRHVPEGTKSVAVTLVFRARERTLTDEEIDAAISAVLKFWAERYGAKLRG